MQPAEAAVSIWCPFLNIGGRCVPVVTPSPGLYLFAFWTWCLVNVFFSSIRVECVGSTRVTGWCVCVCDSSAFILHNLISSVCSCCHGAADD